jgi:ligand-binding sensor domain-containing protein
MLTNTGQIVWQQPDQSLRFSYEMASAVHAMAAAPEGGLWMTHGSDLVKLKSPTPLIQPITGTRLEHLMIDPAGNVWAITDGGSALQYRPDADQWIRHLLTKPAPLEAELDPIQQIVASADGTVYAVGLSGLGELTAAGDLITATAALTTTALPYPAHRHRALFPLDDALANRPDALRNSQSATAPHGGIWLAIIDQPDLWHYAKGRVTMLAHPLSGRDVLGLYIDQRGWLWEVGNGQQLAVYDGQNWRTIAMPDLGTVKRIAGAPDGRLWVVGERGVAVYDPKLDKRP